MNISESFQTPHNLQSEQSILGGLLIDGNAIDRIGELVEKDFYSEAHRLIFKAIQKQAADGKQWDAITVAELLEQHKKLEAAGGLQYIGTIASNVPSSANIKRHAEIVRENSKRRQIMEAVNELSEIVSGKGDVDAAMDKVQSRLLAITEGCSRLDEPRSITEIIIEHMDTIGQRLSNDRKGIATGLTDLDAMLNGGWHRGQLVVIAGRPGMGKSALSLHNSIEAAKAGYGVLYLSMEMVAAELADRAIASNGHISLGSVLSGVMNEREWEGVTVANGTLHELPLHVVDRSGLNFFQVASYARRHKRKNGLDMLVVDYLQLMAGEGDKRHSQIEEITRSLKALAKELNIAILLLSQLSRKTENARKPKLSDLRDSSSIEQDADVVIFIDREEVDNPETTWKGYADLHVAKQRQGAIGRVGVTYIGSHVRFADFAGTLPDFSKQTTKREFN
jgi:replicative DNA helicase